MSEDEITSSSLADNGPQPDNSDAAALLILNDAGEFEPTATADLAGS